MSNEHLRLWSKGANTSLKNSGAKMYLFLTESRIFWNWVFSHCASVSSIYFSLNQCRQPKKKKYLFATQHNTLVLTFSHLDYKKNKLKTSIKFSYHYKAVSKLSSSKKWCIICIWKYKREHSKGKTPHTYSK